MVVRSFTPEWDTIHSGIGATNPAQQFTTPITKLQCLVCRFSHGSFVHIRVGLLNIGQA
ncbi:hypothetical protein MP228_000908 [Amoeboaphelidium protococcarum]|nr:hypothetical protein MP228_000908 [Amoeboaphelidium protococcarum]